MFKNIIWISLIVLSFLIAGILRIKKPLRKNDEELIVGIIAGYEPFAIINEQGELEGFDIEIAKELAQRMNKKLIFKDMNLATLFLALQQKRIDLILTSLSITPERQEKMAMVKYYGKPTTTYPLVFWKEIPENIKGIEDFENKDAVICFEPGSAQDKFLSSFSFLQLKPLSLIMEIIMDLKYKKCTAALLDPDIVDAVVNQNPELNILPIQLPKEFQSSGYGIAIEKENQQLIENVQEIIKQINEEGKIAQFAARWLQKGAR